MSAKDDELIGTVYRKIEREKQLINAAQAMMRSADSPAHKQSIESQIREAQRNRQYLEERMRELQTRKMNQGMENMSIDTGAGSRQQGGPPPPPKDPNAQYGGDTYGSPPGGGDYSDQLGGGRGMMPPRPPFAGAPGTGPGAVQTKGRPQYSKLDLIKYDTPHLGPRIQLMLQQLEFKLSVEKQYKEGIEKMVRLYQIEGDRKSRADAESKRVESNQKIQLLKQALKRYEDLHVDMDSMNDAADDDSINTPNMRKPLTGHLSMKIHAVKDVAHAATGRFARGPETFVIVKVEDLARIRTKASRTDRWPDEQHDVQVDKANEIEVTVYDKPGDHPLPIGMLWIRISDIVEELRRQKIQSELPQGWMSADGLVNGAPSQQDQYGGFSPQSAHGHPGGPGGRQSYNKAPAPSQQSNNPQFIDAWFSLEPVGQIHLTMSFTKQQKQGNKFDAGLGRKGAVRARKEEVHEMYGHKFVQHQFYAIMRCALCGDFLRYSAGMQCSDCKYTCHKGCYPKVVTKCISKSNAESDPDEEKLNHRIPHRFENFTNVGANWCCHCGYLLPIGRTQNKKCAECKLTAHAHCTHLVPDFCGMSMEVANQILSEIRHTRTKQTSGLVGKTLRPNAKAPQQFPYPQDQLTQGEPKRGSSPEGYDPNRVQSFDPDAAASLTAAKAVSQGNTSPTQARPPAQRTQSSQSATAAAAAAAAMTGKRTPSENPSYGNRPTTQSTVSYGGRSDEQAMYGQHMNQSPAQQSQQPQQPAYNPAAYATVSSGYPPQQQVQQQYAQQPPPPQQVQVTASAPPSQVSPAKPPQQQIERKPTRPVAAEQPPRIGLDHFNFLAVLGKGNFGKVMLAETKATKKLYAIKVLKKEFIIENDEVESTRSEKRVFLVANKERHPFLLNLHACFQTETRVYFVMEYISGGDLMLHIQRGQFGTKRAQFYAAEVCLALKYFHENGVIYRDLKLDNILLTLDGHIKIADYGLCKEDMWYGSTTSTFCGTPEFMAPEILLDKRYGRAVDWWAFGVLIYQMLLQQSPFRGEDEDEIYDAILADEPLYPIHMPRDSVSILQKLLMREPEMRLGSGPTDAQEIMSHPFFRDVNWDDIYKKRIQPPFKPQITSATDTSNFDSEFTSVTPVLTPVQSVLTQAMQEEFRGFSYSADII